MSRLEELIQELCPNGVEYKPLCEITNLTAGDRIIKSMMDDGMDYPVYGGGVSPTGRYSEYNFKHSITISRAGSAGYVNWVENEFWATDVCFVSSQKYENVNIKFVYYFVKNMQCELKTKTYGGNLPKLNKDYLWNLLIPIPPLPVQEEIVRILDNFTELTTELTKELTARKNQYEYYRDNIISKYEKTNIVELGNVCKFVRGPFGGALKKEIFKEEGYAVYEQQHAIYQNSDIRYFVDKEKYNELKRFAVKPGDIIVSCSGTIGKTYIIPNDAPEGVINQALLKLTPQKVLNVYYLQYFFENTIMKLMNGAARGGAIKNVPSVDELKRIPISLPSLDEQNRIVNILDRFYALCNDITSGLPAEIEARQKQYEYYRDKLLTFKPLVKE